MPLVNISTSINVRDKDKFLEKSSNLLSTLTCKPEDYVMVKLIDSISMSFACSTSPCCFIEIKSIGSLNPSKMSSEFCEFISHELCIPESRIYINFEDISPSMWGWNKKTFG
tara:strand:+ start:52 stop:387 length:336 start_codon:yes stop_codon:yes gene_type:complete